MTDNDADEIFSLFWLEFYKKLSFSDEMLLSKKKDNKLSAAMTSVKGKISVISAALAIGHFVRVSRRNS